MYTKFMELELLISFKYFGTHLACMGGVFLMWGDVPRWWGIPQYGPFAVKRNTSLSEKMPRIPKDV